MQSTTIADLPCEVVASILKNLDNTRFILSCLLVCRKFYISYQQYPSVKKNIVANHIGKSLLPYAVAVRVASHLPKPLSAVSIDQVLDNIYGPQAQLNTRSYLNQMAFDDLRHLVRMHDIIHDLVMEFASKAWSIVFPDDVNLSPLEYFRFYRAFYRFELLRGLFLTLAPSYDDLANSKAKAQFLSKHPPWENEQIACVHDFLGWKMSKGQWQPDFLCCFTEYCCILRDVLSHDVHFGCHRVNYVAFGSDSIWHQVWLSQGIEFVNGLQTQSFHDIKRSLPDSPHGLSVQLCGELNSEYNSRIVENGLLLEEYSQEELDSLTPREDPADTDIGPYQGWVSTHSYRSQYAFVMFVGDEWLRQRAYVLWDSSRLHSNFWDMLTDPPEELMDRPSQAEWDAMTYSWTERMDVSLHGGSGYWAEGDLSRIVWAESTPRA